MIDKSESIKSGSEVSIVNPVSVQPERFHANAEVTDYLENIGFKVTDYTALQGDDFERVDRFNSAVASGAKALFPVTGNNFGENLIDKIDYEKIKELKPMFTTFSAASTFQLAIQSQSELETFYGPHISFIQSKSSYRENSYTVTSYLNMLCGTSARWGLQGKLSGLAFRNRLESEGTVMRNIISRIDTLGDIYKGEPIPFIGKTEASQMFVTGKLLPTFLQGLDVAGKLGIELDLNNNILLVESNDTSYEKALEHMKSINETYDLSKLSAIVLASFIHRKTSEKDFGYSLYDKTRASIFVREVEKIVKNNIPVLYGFPIGHGRYKLTVPIGINAKLDLATGDLYLTESPYKDVKKSN